MWEGEIKRRGKKVGEERRGKGGKGENKKGGRKKKEWGKREEITLTRLETIAIVVFLVNILVNTCSFFCTLITSWQVGLAVSRPCLLPELSSTDLSIRTQVQFLMRFIALPYCACAICIRTDKQNYNIDNRKENESEKKKEDRSRNILNN